MNLVLKVKLLPIHFRKSQLPDFFLRCRISVKQQNTKAIQLFPHLSDLQPAV